MRYSQRGGFDSREDEFEKQRGYPMRRALLVSFGIAAILLLWVNGALGAETSVAKLPAPPAKTEIYTFLKVMLV